nr:hypothetical protein Iba_chr15fCG6500 [Ipomoea batatas]
MRRCTIIRVLSYGNSSSICINKGLILVGVWVGQPNNNQPAGEAAALIFNVHSLWRMSLGCALLGIYAIPTQAAVTALGQTTRTVEIKLAYT